MRRLVACLRIECEYVAAFLGLLKSAAERGRWNHGVEQHAAYAARESALRGARSGESMPAEAKEMAAADPESAAEFLRLLETLHAYDEDARRREAEASRTCNAARTAAEAAEAAYFEAARARREAPRAHRSALAATERELGYASSRANGASQNAHCVWLAACACLSASRGTCSDYDGWGGKLRASSASDASDRVVA
jgi:hypothetical protein